MNTNDKQLLSQIKETKEAKKKANSLVLVFFVVPNILFLAGLMFLSLNIPLGVIVIAISIFLYVLSAKYYRRVSIQQQQLKDTIGQSIVSDILTKQMELSRYLPNQCLDKEFIKQCGIFPHYDSYSGSDYIQGTYHGVSMVYCDLNLQKEDQCTDSQGDFYTSRSSVFQGSVINLTLKHPLPSYVRIYEQQNSHKIKNVIETENALFNQHFIVSSPDSALAQSILTPQFMEQITQISQITKGTTNIECTDGRITIAINNGFDAFETQNREVTDTYLDETRQQFQQEFATILSIIDKIIANKNLF